MARQPPVVWALAGGGLVVLVALLVGGWALSGPGQVTISGTFTVADGAITERLPEFQGASATSRLDALNAYASGQEFACPRLTGGYSDIGTGTQIRVSDAAGTLLGVGSLTGGVARWDLGGCQFMFEVVAEASDLYQVEVAKRGQLAWRHDELETNGWQVVLNL